MVHSFRDVIDYRYRRLIGHRLFCIYITEGKVPSLSYVSKVLACVLLAQYTYVYVRTRNTHTCGKMKYCSPHGDFLRLVSCDFASVTRSYNTNIKSNFRACKCLILLAKGSVDTLQLNARFLSYACITRQPPCRSQTCPHLQGIVGTRYVVPHVALPLISNPLLSLLFSFRL